MVRYVSYLTKWEAEMMFILRAIGNFFVKIGRWIKDTAWVQPLLIVGGIFAIIFSIPYISNWVGSWFSDSNEAVNFYSNYKVSLDGVQYESKNSDANKLFNYMASEIKSEADTKRWGEKFFVVFVQEDCTECERIYKGFEICKNEWGTGSFKTPDGETYNDFKLYTIFVDTEATINNETKNLFKDYFYNLYDVNFENIAAKMQDSAYATNVSGYKSKIETALSHDEFATPTIFLYDAKGGSSVGELGVSEVVLDLNGRNSDSGVYPLAYALYDCWYGLDVFSPDYNK